MASLSTLLEMRKDIASINIDRTHRIDNDSLCKMDLVLEGIPDLPRDLLQESHSLVQSKHDSMIKNLAIIVERVDKNIQDLQEACWQQGELYAESMSKLDHNSFVIMCEKFYGPADRELTEHINIRLAQYSNWQKTALAYRFDNYARLDCMYGFFPIYVMDLYRESALFIEKNVPAEQSRKIRFYEYDDRNRIPSGHFQVIISRNHFTHRSNSQIQNELPWLIMQLGAGGVLAFNYNDCEKVDQAKLFEAKQRSYQTSNNIESMIQRLGMQIIHHQHLPQSKTTWIEAVKPGEFKSIRRSEALGRILRK